MNMRVLLLTTFFIVFFVSIHIGEARERKFGVRADGPECLRDSKVSKQRDNNKNEENWVKTRRTITQPALEKFLQIPAGSLDKFSDDDLPLLSLALSGGGWRAMLTDLGTIIGLSTPHPDIPDIEHLWDSFTYFSGVSGGSWFLTSFSDLLNSPEDYKKDLYDRLSSSVMELPDMLVTWFDIAADWAEVPPHIPTSMMNIYGPIIASHLLSWTPEHPVNPADSYPSGIFERLSGKIASNIANASIPFPLIVAAHVELDAPTGIYPDFFEFSPYEVGSISPGVEGWIPTQCLNTIFQNGSIPSFITPYSGDNTAIIMGTAGSGPFALTFAQMALFVCEDLCAVGCGDFCAWLEVELNSSASWNGRFFPGVFNNFLLETGVTGPLNSESTMLLIDSGVSQNLPLMPLLIRKQNKYIFVVDASQPGVGGPPLGDALVAFALYAAKHGLNFPEIPSVFDKTIQFGVLPENLQGEISIFGAGDKTVPTLVYIPLKANSSLTPDWKDFNPYFGDSKTSFSVKEIDTMVELNQGRIQSSQVIDSVRCVILQDLGFIEKGSCECSICYGV